MKKGVIMILLVSALLVMVLFLVTLIFFISSFRSLFQSEKKDIHSYQYSQLNPKTNEGSQGTLTSYEDIESFKYYVDEMGSSHLISHFGQDEYQCIGHCYCENSNRRSTGTLLSRGFTYLAAATSSIYALKLAQDYFDEECRKRFSDTDVCEPSSIQSEVEDCALFAKRGTLKTKEKTVANTKKNKKVKTKEKKGKKKFSCSGACTYNYVMRTTEGKQLKFRFSWESLDILRLLWKGIRHSWANKCTQISLDTTVNARSVAKAYDFFLERKLQPYCQQNSLVDIVTRSGVKRTYMMCAGVSDKFMARRIEARHVENPTIQCREIEAIDF